jgi:hypothetical protein
MHVELSGDLVKVDVGITAARGEGYLLLHGEKAYFNDWENSLRIALSRSRPPSSYFISFAYQ